MGCREDCELLFLVVVIEATRSDKSVCRLLLLLLLRFLSSPVVDDDDDDDDDDDNDDDDDDAAFAFAFRFARADAQSVARANVVRNNVFHDGPRSGVNFNDGHAGGEVCVCECARVRECACECACERVRACESVSVVCCVVVWSSASCVCVPAGRGE